MLTQMLHTYKYVLKYIQIKSHTIQHTGRRIYICYIFYLCIGMHGRVCIIIFFEHTMSVCLSVAHASFLSISFPTTTTTPTPHPTPHTHTPHPHPQPSLSLVISLFKYFFISTPSLTKFNSLLTNNDYTDWWISN